MSVRCALVIGHKVTSPGAVNQNMQISEFEFNEQLAFEIEREESLTMEASMGVAAAPRLP